MGRDPLSWGDVPAALVGAAKNRYIAVQRLLRGAIPEVAIAGGGALAGGLCPAPFELWFPGQGSDLDSLACKAGVLPIRRTGKANSADCRAASLTVRRGEAALPLSSPRPRRLAASGLLPSFSMWRSFHAAQPMPYR